MCPFQGSSFVCLDTHNHIFSGSNQLATFSHEPTGTYLRSLEAKTKFYSHILKNLFLCNLHEKLNIRI